MMQGLYRIQFKPNEPDNFSFHINIGPMVKFFTAMEAKVWQRSWRFYLKGRGEHGFHTYLAKAQMPFFIFLSTS